MVACACSFGRYGRGGQEHVVDLARLRGLDLSAGRCGEVRNAGSVEQSVGSGAIGVRSAALIGSVVHGVGAQCGGGGIVPA